MDAVSVIKNNMNVERILDHYNIQHKYYGDIIRCCCPLHKGDEPTAFVINQDFLWYCHTGDCGKGDVFHFVEAMEDIEFPQAVKLVAQILGIDIDNLVIAERKNDYVKEMESFLRYIKSKKKEKKEYNEYIPKAELQTVRQFRDFEEETLRHFGLMYTKEIEVEKKSGGEFKLYERLVIPIYKDKKFVKLHNIFGNIDELEEEFKEEIINLIANGTIREYNIADKLTPVSLAVAKSKLQITSSSEY